MLILALALATGALPAGAATTAREIPEIPDLEPAPPPGYREVELSLAKLHGSSAPVNLTGVSDTLPLSLPVPALWQVNDAVLQLRVTPSQSLINTSQLVVLVNGKVAHQFPLERKAEEFSLDLPLPVNLLEPGFNRVDVRAIQHYTDECEYPEAPQLWTQVNMAHSRFLIKAMPSPVQPHLLELDHLFDRATWREKPVVTVITPGDADAGHVRAMGLVAQGVGQRYDFVPVELRHRKLPVGTETLSSAIDEESRVAVIIGTFEQLKGATAGMDFPRDSGPVIAIKTLPGDITRYAVMLMGANGEEMVSAASAFAIQRVPWPDSDWVAINQVEIPVPKNLEKRFSIPTMGSGAFPLRALGFRTTTLRGLDREGISLRIWNNSWQGRMQVRVHMSYASGMGHHSSLAVLTNGVMHSQIPLNNPEGGVYENYAVTIPAGSMKPGWNTLELKPYMMPHQAGGHCQAWFYDNMGVTVYEDTTIQKFGGSEFKQTDLSLISGQGLLFTEEPLGRNIAFHIAGEDSDTLSSAMTLMAKLSQIYDRPLLNASFGAGDEEHANNHYWIGAWDKLPETIRESLGSSIPAGVDFRVPVMQSATVQVYEGNEWISAKLEEFKLRRTPPANTTEVEINLNGTFEDKNFAMSARNSDGEPMIVFTAVNSEQLRKGVVSVVDYGLWAQLRGMLSYWSSDGKHVISVAAEDAPFSAFGLRGGMGLWVSQHPWLALSILVLMVAVLVILTRKVLRQYQVRRKALED